MLDSTGFDNWAGEYDKSIDKFSNGYPFEGYYTVLSYVRNLVGLSRETKILDIGIGTGLLTYELYKNGGQVYGVDFSDKMIMKAKEKMPRGTFYKYDFNHGIPDEIKNIEFDYIVSSYAIHHINDEEKINFIIELKKILKRNGKIIIADISFENKKDMEKCKEESGKFWDGEEFYFTGNEMVSRLNKEEIGSKYIKISSCAGALIVD